MTSEDEEEGGDRSGNRRHCYLPNPSATHVDDSGVIGPRKRRNTLLGEFGTRLGNQPIPGSDELAGIDGPFIPDDDGKEVMVDHHQKDRPKRRLICRQKPSVVTATFGNKKCVGAKNKNELALHENSGLVQIEFTSAHKTPNSVEPRDDQPESDKGSTASPSGQASDILSDTDESPPERKRCLQGEKNAT
uniref:Uncharacterized protein n=1 Tax=Plectus sambesii TaxID=2011161 RepID=A0A914W5G3_9BILA